MAWDGGWRINALSTEADTYQNTIPRLDRLMSVQSQRKRECGPCRKENVKALLENATRLKA